ncbi:MAG: ribbon-helix-helix domain-containing protein [Pseudomonadota bacterium]
MDHTPQRVQKRSLTIAGHRTSVSLEEAFWHHLKRLAAARGLSLSALVAEVDREPHANLSSALRVYVLRNLEAGN